MTIKLSLGKTNTLQLISTESTTSVILIPKIKVSDFAKMCLLIQPYSLLSSSCSLEPIAQSGLLQCIPHGKPPCHLLHLDALPSRVGDFNPLGHPFKKNYICHSRHTQAVYCILVASSLAF